MTEFSDFWQAYPRKVAKKAAVRAWARVSLPDRVRALEAIPAHTRYWMGRGPDWLEYVPHPATWINGERWEDQLPTINAAARSQASEASAATAAPINGGKESGDVGKSETATAGVGIQMPRDGSIPSAAPIRLHEARPIGEIISGLRKKLGG